MPKTLARRIKAARKAAGLTQEVLADTCQVSRSAASQWEKEGGTAPSIERVGTIAEFLGVSLDWLVLGRGTPGQHLQRSAESSFQREVFAAGLRWARQMHRLSTQDLAKIIPVSHARYLSLEAQKADPTLAELATLARHFDGIPLEFFVLGQTSVRGRDEAGSLPRAAIRGSGGGDFPAAEQGGPEGRPDIREAAHLVALRELYSSDLPDDQIEETATRISAFAAGYQYPGDLEAL